MFDLSAYLETRTKQVNDVLLHLFDTHSDAPRIQKAMRYSLLSGGKRIRPILCIAAFEAVGDRLKKTILGQHILTAAASLEVLHTYSLIHDDLPAMDDDDLRRGIPTCHIAFDEATAVLAGDALLTLAFQMLSSIPVESKEDAKILINIIHAVSQAAGYQGMVEGQMRDLAAENTTLPLENMEEMHRLKTGALIKASVYTGAVLGGGNASEIERLSVYAAHIGLAFQVVDDILNVEGDTDMIGKPVGSDQLRGKNTYPSLMGLEESKAFGKKLVDDALKVLDDFDSRSDPLRAIASYIIERKH